MSQPGQLFTYPYRYDPRFPMGQGNVKVISAVASEDIPTGVLVQMLPDETVRIARNAFAIAGVSTFNPAFHTSGVVYNKYDMVPVVRIGQVFARFVAKLPPFRDPFPFEDAYFYADTGVFTTDLTAGVHLLGAQFALATHEYYPGVSGSPAADVPFPVPPIPLGAQSTTFGEGLCLIDLNLG